MELSYPQEKLTGGKVTQVTDSDKTDVLPVFSPDGRKLMWTSTRTGDGSSQLFIGDWLRESRP
jgi:Tol biopolymer transport system component